MLKFYNPPWRQGLPPTPGRARVLTVGDFPAPVLISDDLPCRLGLPPTPGRPAERFDWTPGGRGWLGAGSREAREIRMFNHWAAGLRSGLLPEDCGVATPKRGEKRGHNLEVWKEVLIFGYMDL